MAWIRPILWTGTIAFWVLICVLTHLPPHDLHVGAGINDKVAHFTAYFLLSFGIGLSMVTTFPGRRWIPILMIALAMAYGAVDERTQPLFGRDCELYDWFADLGGASTAALLICVAQRLFKNRRPSVGRQLVAAFEGGVLPAAAGEAQ